MGPSSGAWRTPFCGAPCCCSLLRGRLVWSPREQATDQIGPAGRSDSASPMSEKARGQHPATREVLLALRLSTYLQLYVYTPAFLRKPEARSTHSSPPFYTRGQTGSFSENSCQWGWRGRGALETLHRGGGALQPRWAHRTEQHSDLPKATLSHSQTGSLVCSLVSSAALAHGRFLSGCCQKSQG